jgi:biotin carboxyl carrier protein
MMERRYFLDGVEHRASLRPGAEGPSPFVDGSAVEAELRPAPDGTVLVRFGAVTYRALVDVQPDYTDVCVDGHHFRLRHQAPPRTGGPGRAAGGAGVLGSPMTGCVRRVLVHEGQPVEQGTTLLIVEAMKMELPVRAPVSGIVKRIHVAVGDQAEMGAPLLELAAPAAEA